MLERRDVEQLFEDAAAETERQLFDAIKQNPMTRQALLAQLDNLSILTEKLRAVLDRNYPAH